MLRFLDKLKNGKENMRLPLAGWVSGIVKPKLINGRKNYTNTNKMKVSHELPLSLMTYAYQWNDYDYCLPHLVDKYEQYRIFFQKSRLDKRFIIMDNGLFEGVEHTTEDLLDKINLIHPSIFIVPDAWNDSAMTIRNAKHWMINYKKHLPEKTNLMAVCQGKNIGELMSYIPNIS